MYTTLVFVTGAVATLAIGLAVVWYLKLPLQHILIELCGNQERAGFWAAFSSVALGLTPTIFAIAYHPEPGTTPVIFELADQLKWGLVGLMTTLLVLGWVIARTIVRFEGRSTKVARSETR